MTTKPDPNKLDTKRSYGTVYGDPNIGFVQDNKYFKPDGTPYEPSVAPLAVKAEEKPAPEPEVAPDKRRAAQSEAMKRIWAERREALAKQRTQEE